MTDWNYDMASAPKDRPILIWAEKWGDDINWGMTENCAAVCVGLSVVSSCYYGVWAINPRAWAEVTEPVFPNHQAGEAE